MELFQTTKTAVQEFQATMSMAKDAFAAAKKEIMATFNSKTAEDKLTAARQIFDQTGNAARKKAKDAVMADFADVSKKISDSVTAAAPADFQVTLEALKQKGKEVTDFEVNAFLEKYKGSNLAFSTLLDVLHSIGKATEMKVYTPDEVCQMCQNNEDTILNWINGYQGGSSYMTSLLTDDKNTPLNRLASNVNAFLAGGFLHGDSED